MTAALYFDGDAYSISGPKLMGRNAAGASFLRGYFEHATADRLWIEVGNAEAARPFVAAAREAGLAQPIEVVLPTTMAALATPGTLYFPASNIGMKARHRSLFGDAGWSICGVTHTTASARAMDGIADLVTGAVQPWDALICTSLAVRNNVHAIFDAEVDRLQRRLGVTRVVRPEMPVIPLGIHTQDFVFEQETRSAARAQIGAGEQDVVVLYAGRLSFHAKAHPAAMYLALEAAAQRVPADARVILVECGWFANASIQDSFEKANAALCPNVRVVRIDGREAAGRTTAWASADLFCSLADNIQETFGLTPLEAMAAGLPVVVSDWDGYRDTVRDGIDGFRIATIAPSPGAGGDLAARHALDIDTYDRYCGYSGAFVAIDIAAAAEAFAALFASPDLRRKMGAAGQERARADRDWRSIIPRYEALWAMLGDIRKTANRPAMPTHPWPARMDPFSAFADYPSDRLVPTSVITLIDGSVEAALRRLKDMLALTMISYVDQMLPTQPELEALIAGCAKGARRASDLVSDVAPERRSQIFRSLAWLAKIGVVRIAN